MRILRSKKTKVLATVMLLIMIFAYGLFDGYESISEDQLHEAGLTLEPFEKYSEYRKILQANGIKLNWDQSAGSIGWSTQKGNAIIRFSYLPGELFANDSLFVSVDGPLTMESGIRFFLLPDYSNILIANTSNLSILKEFRVWGHVVSAAIVKSNLYIRFKNGKLGRLKF